jgi:hypothetical protein
MPKTALRLVPTFTRRYKLREIAARTSQNDSPAEIKSEAGRLPLGRVLGVTWIFKIPRKPELQKPSEAWTVVN